VSGSSVQTPTRPRRLKARERDRQALEMRMRGLTFAAIGAELGVTYQAAQQAVRRSLEVTKAEIAEKAQELRAIEAERLDKITETLWPRVLEGDLRAIDRVLRARESYRRLTGLDVSPGDEVQGTRVVVVDARLPWSREQSIDGETIEPTQIGPGL